MTAQIKIVVDICTEIIGIHVVHGQWIVLLLLLRINTIVVTLQIAVG